MNLNEDVVWNIIRAISTDPRVDIRTRLNTTRISSQICRRWRDTILGSPATWGRMVYIHRSQRQEWIQEVIRRSGSSNLHISADIPDDFPYEYLDRVPGPITSVVFSVLLQTLQQEWTRVERLDINLNHEGYRMLVTSELWDCIGRPAPVLRSIVFSTGTPIDKRVEQRLFAGSAPLLHTFVCCVRFIPLKSPWLSNLRILRWKPTGSIHDLFIALSSMPHLTSLRIDESHIKGADLIDSIGALPLPVVNLPQLTDMHTSISFNVFTALWNCLSVSSSGCIIHSRISMPTNNALPDVSMIHWFGQAIEGMARQSVKVDKKTYAQPVRLNVQKSCLTIGNKTSFSLLLTFSEYISSETSAHLYNTFAPLLQHITHLSLRLSPPMLKEEVLDFRGILNSLHSVMDLTIDSSFFLMMERLKKRGLPPFAANSLSSSNNDVLILPELKIIRTSWKPSTFLERPPPGVISPFPILPFFRLRIDQGLPIHVLRIEDDRSNVAGFCQLLREVVGLCIVWDRRSDNEGMEFVCTGGK